MDFGFLGKRQLSTLLIGLLASTFGMALLFSGTLGAYHAYRLRRAVDQVAGQVLLVYSSQGAHSTSYSLTYSYSDHGLAVTVMKKPITQAQWEVLQPGDTIPIRCLADDPTVSEPDFPGYLSFADLLAWSRMATGLLFASVGFYAALFLPKGSK